MRLTHFVGTATVLAALVCNSAQAAIFKNFKNLSKFTLVGSTVGVKSSDGYVLRLVNNTMFESGAAYLKLPVKLGSNGQFTSNFTFRITGNVNTQWSDGLTFVLAETPTGLGTENGQSLGYSGVQNSVAVEFDTYYNYDFDAAPNEVAVDTDGSVATYLHPAGSFGQPYGQGASCSGVYGIQPTGCLADGQIWTVSITYNGKLVNVSVSDGNNPAYTVINNYSINVLSNVGSRNVYVGFTAATGLGHANFDLISWTFMPLAK